MADNSPATRNALSLRLRPGRFRRAIRRLLLTVLLVTFLHAGWSAYEQWQAGRAVDALHQGGEPILPADFDSPPFPAEQNAATGLRAAAAAIDSSDVRFTAMESMVLAKPLSADASAVIKSAVDANPRALSLTDSATTQHAVDWQLQMQSPVALQRFADLLPQRNLAILLSFDALDAHSAGDDERAMRRIAELLFISRAIDRLPVFAGHLVSDAIAALAADRLERILPTLKIEPAGGSPVPGSSTRQQTSDIIAALLSLDADGTGTMRAMRGERMAELDAINCAAGGKLSLTAVMGYQQSVPLSWLNRIICRPLLIGDGRIMLRYMTGVIAAARSSDWPTCESRLPPYPPEATNRRILHPFIEGLLPEMDRALELHYREIADRRLAAAALAARAFSIDHAGKYPSTLDELVPGYLAAVPADPLTAGKPIGYRNVGGADDPIFFCDSASLEGSEPQTAVHLAVPATRPLTQPVVP